MLDYPVALGRNISKVKWPSFAAGGTLLPCVLMTSHTSINYNADILCPINVTTYGLLAANINYAHSIMVWHMATTYCISLCCWQFVVAECHNSFKSYTC